MVIRRWFFPNAVGCILVPIVLAFFLVSRGSDFVRAVNEGFWKIGLPTVAEGTRGLNYVLKWLIQAWWWVAVIVLGIYIVAMPVGRLVSGGWGRLADAPAKRGWRRPGAVFAIVVCAVLVVACVGAMLTSKAVWGYYMWRPKLDPRVRAASKLMSVTVFRLDLLKGFQLENVPKRVAHLQRDTDEGDYYSHRNRAFVAMQQQGLISPDDPAMSAERLTWLGTQLESTKFFDPVNWPSCDGYVIEFEGPKKQPMMIVCGRAIGFGDTQMYYELLFSNDSDPPKLLSSTRFYYDVAGFEGFEWPAMWTVFALLGWAIVVPITFLIMLIRRLIEHSRARRQGFPVQPIPSPS